MAAPLAVRLWRRIERGGPDDCWPWTGALSSGYGRIHITRRVLGYTHRLAYEQLVGPIPEGLVIDHLCRSRTCCNPRHMEPVTLGENVRRGHQAAAERKAQAS